MSSLLPGLLGGTLVALIGGVVTYLVAKRSKSGSVKTSEAETVWAQAQEMREELRAQVTACEAKCAVLETKFEEAAKKNFEQAQALATAQEKILSQKGEIIDLKADLAQVREDLRVALRAVARQSETVQSDVDTLKHELSLVQGGKLG